MLAFSQDKDEVKVSFRVAKLIRLTHPPNPTQRTDLLSYLSPDCLPPPLPSIHLLTLSLSGLPEINTCPICPRTEDHLRPPGGGLVECLVRGWLID